MTPYVREFVKQHADKLGEKVIELGSLEVNGTVRDLVNISLGVDMRRGKGVDLVCKVEDLYDHLQPETFDGCISCETLEHVENWRDFIRVSWGLVKEGGYLVMTMAHKNKARHAYPDDYWRMTEEHIERIYPKIEELKVLGRSPNRAVSLGWVVQKSGELGSLDFEPYKVP